MSNQVYDWVHDGMTVGMDFVDSCLHVFNNSEENLTFSISSLNELDIMYTRRVLQSRSLVYTGLPVPDGK